jgi:golgin subfamily B member 1
MMHEAKFFYMHCGDHSKLQSTKKIYKYLNVFCDLKRCNFCPKFLKVRATVHSLTENAQRTIYPDGNAEIIDKIGKCVNERKSLMTTMQIIDDDRDMSRYDEAFVEVNYIEKLLAAWLSEAVTACRLRHVGNVAKIVGQFDTFKKFEDLQFPCQIRTIDSTKLLLQHKMLVSKKDMMSHIFQFKESIILHMVSLSESLLKEYDLILALRMFIRNQKCVQSVCEKLLLADFFKEHSTTIKNLRRYINNIEEEFEEDSNYVELQLCLGSVSDDQEFTSMFKLVKMLKLYSEEITFMVNEKVLLVRGMCVELSECLPTIRDHLHQGVIEVRFVCGDVFHLDCSLQGEEWSGINLVILANQLRVWNEQKIDLSGKCCIKSHADAGQSENGTGIDGIDGFPGSSGGNALIAAEEVINQQNLEFISNGGAGGVGQKGGDGRDGPPGKAMDVTEMRKGFDSYIRSKCRPGELIWEQTAPTSRKGDYKRFSDSKPWKPIPDDIFSLDMLKRIGESVIDHVEDEYLSNGMGYITGTRLTDSLVLEFNYDHWNKPCLNKSNFFVCYGTNGQAGEPAGEGGLGGDGGFAGNLDTHLKNIATKTNPGKDGQEGEHGEDGSPGLNGGDVGYHDHYYWKKPTYVGENGNRKLQVVPTGKNRKDGLSWCEYLDSYVKLESTALPMQTLKMSKNKAKEKKRIRKQNHATATRSKAISREEIERRYTHELQEADRLMADISAAQRMAAEMMEHAMRSIALNKLQDNDLDIAVEEKVSRQAHYISEKKEKSIPVSCFNAPLMQSIQIVDLKDVAPEKLRIAELTAREIHTAYDSIQNQKWTVEDQRFAKELLLNRYRVLQLQEIDLKLKSFYKDMKHSLVKDDDFLEISNNEYKKENIADFLFVDSAAHREESVRKLKETVASNKTEDLKGMWPLIECVLNECMDAKYKEILEKSKQWKLFQKKFSQNIALSFQNLQEQLFLYVDSQSAWKKWKSGDISKRTLHEELEKHDSVSQAFEKYENYIEEVFDFSSCIKNSSFMKEVYSFFQDTGLTTDAYFYLLHYLFDVNLHIYSPSKTLLKIEGGGLGKSTIVLKRGSPCKPLRINLDLKNLVNSRLLKSTVTREILTKTHTATTINDLSSINTSLDIGFLLKEAKSQCISCRCMPEDSAIILNIMHDSEFHAEIYHTLKLLSSGHFDHFPFLHTLAQRLSYEPILLNDQELLFVLNRIVATVCDQLEDQAEVHWILAVSPIIEWVTNITKINLENHFQCHINEEVLTYVSITKCKDAVMLFNRYLYLREFNRGVTQNSVAEIFRLLSSMQDGEVDVQNLALLSWPFALKTNYWQTKLRSIQAFESDDKKVIIAHFLDNKYGSRLVEELLAVLRERFSTCNEASYIFDAFYTEKWVLRGWVLDILGAFPFEECLVILNKSEESSDIDKTFKELFDIISDNSNSSDLIRNTLIGIKEAYEETQNSEEIANAYSMNIDLLLSELKKCDLSESNYVQQMRALAIVDRAIELFKGFRLRDTQKLAVLVLLTTNSNALLQVSTGEGKSLIVAAAAILKCMRKQNVDIITSSTVLAKRDAECMKTLFGYFRISVNHNCQAKVEDRREVYSKYQVIYGDVSGFQRDFLLDRFYDKNILGDRTFDNVIVDEVDSMLLDKGNNMLYLSHELCGLDKLQSLYVFIWKFINASGNDISYLFDTGALKSAVLYDLFGLVQPNDLLRLCDKLTEHDVENLWNDLKSARVIDCSGKLLIKKRYELEDKMVRESLRHLKPRIQFLLEQILEREKHIFVPKCFHQFIEQHLDSWLNSARNAFFLIEKQDYIVDVDRSGSHLGQNIIILDRNTGTDMTNSQWDEALHQFLQIKHGCKLTAQSLKGVFISNVTYLKKYNHLIGLTGTLGSQPERELLKEIHSVEFLTIPHNKERKFKELSPMLCEDKSEWIENILKEVNFMMQEKRSVLIICDTVQDVNSIYKAMGGKKAANVKTYTREYEDVDLTTGKRSLEPMQILISTNLAGRGTDILLSDTLGQNGGLHVCLTYLTGNSRVEEQAFGRAARAGDHGSGRIICMKDCDEIEDANEQKIFTMKLERDSEELRRLSDIKTFYEKQIKVEEACFDIFSQFYSKAKKDQFIEATKELTSFGADILNVATEYLGSAGEFVEDKLLSEKKKVETVRETIRNIVLRTHLDNWAFWLDKNGSRIELLNTMTEEENFYDELRKYLEEIAEREWKTYVSVNPWITLKLGKFLIETDNNRLAVEILSRAIQNEPSFSAFAHYYKAKALSKNIDWKDERKLFEFEESLQKAEKILSMHNDRLDREAGIISNVRREITSGIVTVNAFEEQLSSQKLVHEVFLRNIGEYFGLQITPDAIHSDSIDKKNAEKIFNQLIQEGFINKVCVSKKNSEKALSDICSRFGIMSRENFETIIDNFRNEDLTETRLIENLRALNLSSRELFWKEMETHEIITNVVNVIIFDCTKLKEYNSELFEKVEHFSSNGKLTKFEMPTHPTGDARNYNIQLHKLYNADTNDSSPLEYRSFLKEDLKSVFGAAEVREFEKNEFGSFNKYAHFNVKKAKALKTWYNTLDLNYFTKFGIQKSEQDLILKQLVECKVLIFESGKYCLGDTTDVSTMKSFPIYDSAIRSILSQNFTFRNTLEDLITQIDKINADSLQSIALHSNPEKRLFFALVDANIIEINKVSDKDFDKKQLEKIIWNFIPLKKATLYEENLREKAKGVLVEGMNYINDEHQDVNVNFVYGVLKNYQNVLKRYEHPTANLQHVANFLDTEKDFDFSILHQSELNEEHEIISWDEAKWTLKIVKGALAVAVLGIAQIAIGVGIQFCTSGWGTQVGSAFISEGVSDIMYSIGALISGRFTWADYKKHKLVSIAFTALTFGIASFLSRKATYSVFGRELAMPGTEVVRNGVVHQATDLAGRHLITKNTIGLFATTGLKKIGSKVVEGVAFGLVSATVDKIIDSQLRSVCSVIARQTRQSVTESIEKHEVNSTLIQLHITFGSKKANEKVDKVTKHFFAKNQVLQQIIIKCKRCFDSVLDGLKAALNVAKDNKALKMTALFSKFLKLTSIASSVVKVASVIVEFYNKVNAALKLELKNHKGENFNGKNNESCEEFQIKIKDSWKGRIDEYVGDILADNVISPVMNKLGKAGMKAAGRRTKSFYEQRKMKV